MACDVSPVAMFSYLSDLVKLELSQKKRLLCLNLQFSNILDQHSKIIGILSNVKKTGFFLFLGMFHHTVPACNGMHLPSQKKLIVAWRMESPLEMANKNQNT